MGIKVDLAEGRRLGDQLGVNFRLVAVVERIGHLHDHHAVEQGFVFLLLEELAEFGQIGVGDDGLVDVDQRKARDLDVLLLGQGQQQVEEFALDLEDLDHFEEAPARRIHRARPGPGARVAFVAVLGDLGEIDRADQIGDVGGGGIVGA